MSAGRVPFTRVTTDPPASNKNPQDASRPHHWGPTCTFHGHSILQALSSRFSGAGSRKLFSLPTWGLTQVPSECVRSKVRENLLESNISRRFKKGKESAYLKNAHTILNRKSHTDEKLSPPLPTLKWCLGKGGSWLHPFQSLKCIACTWASLGWSCLPTRCSITGSRCDLVIPL